MHDKVLVAQGGGPTVVINQSLVGVVLEARKFQHVAADLRRPPRRARHRRRGPGRPHPRDQPQSRDGGRHALLGAGLDPRQARPRLLPGDLQGPAGARHRLLPLHRRQRFRRHRAHRRRGGRRPPATTCAASTSPRPSTTTSSVTDHCPGYPSAARFVAQAFMGANLDNALAARRLRRRGHGPPRRLADRGLGAGPEIPGRRPAPDLPARARLRPRPLPRRREGRHGPPRPLRRRGLRGHPRRQRHRRSRSSSPSRSSATPTATCSSPAPARWPTC